MAARGWPHHKGLPAVPQAVAQSEADLAPDAAAVNPAAEADQAELTADDMEADAEAEANGRPTHAEIKEGLRLERTLAQGRGPSVPLAPPAPVQDAAADRVRALAEQYARMQDTMPADVPGPHPVPPHDPDVPGRLDANDPDPEWADGPPPRVVILEHAIQAQQRTVPAAPPALTDPGLLAAPDADTAPTDR